MEIPGFTIIERVGGGGLGVVCKALQQSLDRTVAVKILKPEFSKDPVEVDAFIHEARTAAVLKHSNIVQVYDVSQVDNCPYIVMEFVNGPTVARLMKTGSVSPKQAMDIALAVAKALDYAWQRAKLIHRDIKPDNIMIDDDGTIKLSDLGLAKRMTHSDADPSPTDLIVGTPNYMSPEQAESGPLDIRSDMYSLGATLYHMLTGQTPFEGSSPLETAKKHVEAQLQNPRAINPAVSVGAVQLITKLMMKSPEKRFKSWEEVIRTIRKVSSGHISLSPPGSDNDSTIAPMAKIDAPRGKGMQALHRISGRATRAPRWLKTTTTLLLLGIWAGLAWQRLSLPPVIAIPERGESSTSTHIIVPPLAPSRTSDNNRPPPATVQPTENRATQSQTQPQPTGTEESPTVSMPSAQQVNDILRTMLHALSEEDFAKAATTLQNPIMASLPEDDQTGIENIIALIGDMSRIPAEIEESFHAKLGSEVTLNQNGQEHTITLTSLAAGKVYGSIKTDGEDDVPVTFAIDQLSATERCRWIPSKDDAAHHALKCILLIKSGQTEEARTHAPKAGALSDLLTRLLGTKHSGQG